MKFIVSITIFALLLSQAALYGTGSNKPSLKSKYQSGTVELIPILRINNNSLPEDQGLSELTDFAISPNKSIFILDGNQNNIKILSESGTFLKKICQKGAGPNDLDTPSLIISNGSQLIVLEIMGNRFSFFSPTGDFQKIVRVPSDLVIKKIQSLPNGQLVVEREVPGTYRNQTVYCQLDLYSPEAQFKKSILKVPVNRYKDVVQPFQVRINFPFVSDVAWNIAPSGNLVYGFQEHYRVYILPKTDFSGKPSSFFHPSERIKITASDKKMVEATYRMMGSNGLQDAPRALLDQISYPNYRPSIGNIVIDSENNILVFPWKQGVTENYDYFDAFDASGKFINRVKLAAKIKAPVKIIFTPANHIWFLTTDDSDERTIVMNEFK